MISMPRFLRPAPRPRRLPPDFDPRVADVCRAVAPFTMTSPERVAALVEAVRYVSRHAIPGVIVECGVWRGGSMMAVAQTLLSGVMRWLYGSAVAEPGSLKLGFRCSSLALHRDKVHNLIICRSN